jgi:plasmid stabilization system protein ParE
VNQLQFSRPASEDLKKICHDMASINARAAAAFVNGIEETCRLCVEHPEMSQPCDELSPGLKFLPTEGYVIFHHRVGMATEIVRILRDPRIAGASESPAAGAASGSFVEFAASLKEIENRYGDLDEQKFYRAAELKPLDRVYHVPRKFGTGSLLVVITFFAAIFAVMRLFMVPPAVMGFVGLQVVAAGVMQWTMAKHPRLASSRVGAGRGRVTPRFSHLHRHVGRRCGRSRQHDRGHALHGHPRCFVRVLCGDPHRRRIHAHGVGR